MTISRQILSALAERPDGELQVSELKSRLVWQAADRRPLADHIRQSKLTGVYDYPIMRAEGASAIFSKGLVDRPRRGVWRITDLGRSYMSSIQSTSPSITTSTGV